MSRKESEPKDFELGSHRDGKSDLTSSEVTQTPAKIPPANLEKHYCQYCNVDQPIRAKHCKDCCFCVATFDHHCVWTGNCVGEKNRPLFLLFLTLQVAEMLVFSVRPFTILFSLGWRLGFKAYPSLLVAGVLMAAFFASTCGLLCYHLHFALSNLTTCSLC